jgi:hypothetical protein
VSLEPERTVCRRGARSATARERLLVACRSTVLLVRRSKSKQPVRGLDDNTRQQQRFGVRVEFHHSNAIRGERPEERQIPARPEERQIPKSAKSRRALNSELREIPKGGTAEGDKGAGSGALHPPSARCAPFLALGSSAFWNSALVGIRRSSGFRALRDFAPFCWRLSRSTKRGTTLWRTGS